MRNRNITLVERIDGIEVSQGMVFYTATCSGESEPRCMPLAQWLELQKQFASALAAYNRRSARVLPFPRSGKAVTHA